MIDIKVGDIFSQIDYVADQVQILYLGRLWVVYRKTGEEYEMSRRTDDFLDLYEPYVKSIKVGDKYRCYRGEVTILEVTDKFVIFSSGEFESDCSVRHIDSFLDKFEEVI